MLVMSEPVFELRKQIKTTAAADAALGRIVASLKNSRRVRWKGGRPTQEAIYNATWLWLEEMGVEAVEDAMARHLPRLEALMRGDEPPAEEVEVSRRVTEESAAGPGKRKRTG
jgi:hypothetical protein